MWFAQRADYLLSYESDPKWYTKVGAWIADQKLNYHTKLLYWPDPPYHLPYDAPRKFHIILVDGRNRVEFAKFALKHLEENGILIFDDFERKKYKPIVEVFEKAGLDMILYRKGLKVQTEGRTVTSPVYETKTAVFSWLG